MKNTFKSIGAKIKEHAPVIIEVSVYVAIAAGFVAIIVASEKQFRKEEEAIEKAQIAEANRVEADRQRLADAVGRGASVLPAPDGNFWIIEAK